MEQFKVAVSSWSFLSGEKPGGFKPVAVQDAPPSGPSPISTLWGPRSEVPRHCTFTVLQPDAQVGHPAWRDAVHTREQIPGCLGVPL